MWDKIKQYMVILMFFGVLILPQLVCLIKDDKAEESAENRTLAEFPTVTKENWNEFPEKFEEYFNDHLAYKQKFVELNQTVNYKCFNIAENEKCVLGEDGWMFCKEDYSLEDYQGIYLYSDERLQEIVQQIVAVDEYYKSIGVEFIFFIAPNKESIYGEYLDSRYRQYKDYTRADQVYDYLKDNTEVTVVFPKEELRSYSSEYELYYKLDTHWSDMGAYIATNSLLSQVGLEEMQAVEEVELVQEGMHVGDLATMLGMTNYLYDEPEIGLDNFSDTQTEVVYSNPHTILFNEKYTSNSNNMDSVYVIGDSFSAKLAEYLKFNYAECTVIHRYEYKAGTVENENTDVVICEVVERYIEQMGGIYSIFVPVQ